VFSGENAFDDAVDGDLTIEGIEYPVNDRLVQALQAHPDAYNAGVVGPDAFPDLVMGQSVIHPEDTGRWLDHVINKAWDAQTDSRYSEDEKLTILAFSYGFLTHAAGDLWAHTLVNDFANGVFPAVGDIVSDPQAAAIALRHVIVEGYIGDATPGFDGNDTRTLVPGETNEDGDPEVSDDSTHAIGYEQPPDLFLWETFVGRTGTGGQLTDPLPGQPTAARGPIIEFFYDLRNDLAEDAGSNSNIQQALDNLTNITNYWNNLLSACEDIVSLSCLEALGDLVFGSFAELAAAAENAVEAGFELVVDAYLAAWVEDIDHGLQHWGNIGDAFAEGLFNPGFRRDVQNEECGETGNGELDTARALCEDGVGLVGTFLEAIGEGFTTDDPHLLSMLGFPDFVAAGIELVDEVFDAIDALVDFPLPFESELAEFQEYLQDLIIGALSDIFGVDLQLYSEILRNPAAWLDEGTPIPLPPPLDVFNSTGLFVDGEHERLDAIIGLENPGPNDDHHQPNQRLDDDIELLISEFAPLENTITTAKLLLLDGDQLDEVLSDMLGRDMDTYPSGQRTNVMIDALGSTDPWLFSIDSDHAWRADGLPRFCNAGDPLCVVHGAQARAADEPNGGTGRMPIWESCVARPAFRELFTDWENDENFPDLGDGVSADPGSDPAAPTSSATLDPDAAYYDSGTREFVGGDNEFTLGAVDGPTGKGFPVTDLELQYRVTYPDGTNTGWLSADPGDTFSLDGADGKYIIETQAGDPCHTLDTEDDLPAETVQSAEYWLDTTAPVCTCHTPPFGNTYDSDDTANVDFSLDDGVDGSGVDQSSVSAVLDGYLTSQTATRSVTDGTLIDMYLYYPGTRTVTVTAADNIGNTADTDCTFTLAPTSASIANNLVRARNEGHVPNNSVYRGLTDKINQAVSKHTRGQHAVEANALDAFADQIDGQIGGGPSGSGINLVTGARLSAYARYALANGA
jgi:hypothetical protein